MAYNYARTQGTALRLITKFGREARLVRVVNDVEVERKCICVLIDYTTSEIGGANGLIAYGDQKALVASKGLTIPPDNELDYLKIGANQSYVAPFEKWRLVRPPSKLDPAGIVIYWELQVRK